MNLSHHLHIDPISLTRPTEPAAPPPDDRHYQMCRQAIVSNWQRAFDVSRETNRPPKYEVQQVEAISLIAAGILMYNYIPDPNPSTRLVTFLDMMEVGGYRMGRTRMGTPWASVFVRNVQYSMSKYVPNNVRFPELTLLGLAVRPNMHRVHEFLRRDMRHPEAGRRLQANGCRVNLLQQPHNHRLQLVINYLEFTHSVDTGDFEQHFNRRFDRRFIEYIEARHDPSPFRPQANDFDGDVAMMMDE